MTALLVTLWLGCARAPGPSSPAPTPPAPSQPELLDRLLFAAGQRLLPDDLALVIGRPAEADSARGDLPETAYDLDGDPLSDLPTAERELCWRDAAAWLCAAWWPEGVVVHRRR